MSDPNRKPLGAIVYLVTEKISVNKDHSKPYVGLEHIGSNSSTLVGIGSANDSVSSNNIFLAGDMLFGKLRPRLRKCVRVEFDGYCSTDILVLRANKANSSIYASKLLQSETVFSEAIRKEEGTKMPRTSWQEIKNVLVFCPSLPQQRKIACILTTVDNLIERTEAAIAKYEAIKQGMMHDLFTRGVDAHGRLRPPYVGSIRSMNVSSQNRAEYSNGHLEDVPDGFRCAVLGELFTKRREPGRPGLPIMSVTMADGLVERSSLDRRVDSNLPPEGHLLVLRDDIAYNMMRMWQGVSGRAETDCLVSPAYVVLKPNETIDSEFMAYFFKDLRSIKTFRRFSQGVVDDRLRLYFHDLRRIQFLIPESIDEQKKIARSLAALDRKIKIERDSSRKYQQIKSSLMRDLLTGKVRVNVVDTEKDAAHG